MQVKLKVPSPISCYRSSGSKARGFSIHLFVFLFASYTIFSSVTVVAVEKCKDLGKSIQFDASDARISYSETTLAFVQQKLVNEQIALEQFLGRSRVSHEQELLSQSELVRNFSDSLIAYYIDSDLKLEKSVAQELRYYIDSNSERRVIGNEALRLWYEGVLSDSPHYTKKSNGSSYFKGHSVNYEKFSKLKQAFNAFPSIPAGINLYRGEVILKSNFLPKAGDIFQMRGLTSTSIDPKVALDFMKPKESHPDFSDDIIRVLYKIKPISIKGIFIPYVGWNYNSQTIPVASISPNLLREEEYILHPLTKFKVISQKKRIDKIGQYVEIAVQATN